MITLGPAHHAQVHRLLVADKPMSPLGLMLWREQHPNGHEQIMLDFTEQQRQAEVVPLFYEREEES